MKKLRSMTFLVFLILFVTPLFSNAYGHSAFNSAEQFEAGYRVQVATLPEFPQIGEKSQILVRVTDENYEEVDRFTMGIRIFYNGQQVDAIPPQSYETAHHEFDYVWERSGNHIVRVDLYDMGENAGVVSYVFNMSTQSPFGYIFIIAITVGAMTLGVVILYIYFPKKKFKIRS